MTTATVLPFPPTLTVAVLRAFHIASGPGHVVAVLFRVDIDGMQRGRRARDKDGRDDQAGERVGASE